MSISGTGLFRSSLRKTVRRNKKGNHAEKGDSHEKADTPEQLSLEEKAIDKPPNKGLAEASLSRKHSQQPPSQDIDSKVRPEQKSLTGNNPKTQTTVKGKQKTRWGPKVDTNITYKKKTVKLPALNEKQQKLKKARKVLKLKKTE